MGGFVGKVTLYIDFIVAFILPIQIGLIFGKDHPTMGAGIDVKLFKLAFRTNHYRPVEKIKAEISSIIPSHQLR